MKINGITITKTEREAYWVQCFLWAGAMYGCAAAMPAEEREALEKWENENISGDGSVSTSDWPGWKKYIGERPKRPWLVNDNLPPLFAWTSVRRPRSQPQSSHPSEPQPSKSTKKELPVWLL